MRVSVVIPTDNRGESLRASVESLLRSDSAGINAVEAIVVDDGSVTPVTGVVESIRVNGPITRDDSLSIAVMKVIKAVLSTDPLRAAVVQVTLLGEPIGLVESWLRRLYRTALAIHFFAGIRDGLRRYAK